jgi:hypothetical protein
MVSTVRLLLIAIDTPGPGFHGSRLNHPIQVSGVKKGPPPQLDKRDFTLAYPAIQSMPGNAKSLGCIVNAHQVLQDFSPLGFKIKKGPCRRQWGLIFFESKK